MHIRIHSLTYIFIGMAMVCAYSFGIRYSSRIDEAANFRLLREYMVICATTDNRHLYVAATPIFNFDTDLLFWLSRDNGKCEIRPGSGPFPSSVTVPSLTSLYGHIHVLRNGRFVYAMGLIGPGETAAITWFARDTVTGALTLVGTIAPGMSKVSGLLAPYDFAITANDLRLVTLSSDTLAWYEIDLQSGRPSFVSALAFPRDTSQNPSFPVKLLATGSGENLYMVSRNSYRLDWFFWSSTSHSYVFGGSVCNSWLTDTTCKFPSSMALSPDERYLYLAVGCGGGLCWYQRDSVSGKLSFVAKLDDTTNSRSILKCPLSIAMSPDGGVLYVGAETSDSIVWLKRDRLDGSLSYGGTAGAGSGHMRVTSIQPTFDGTCVYATAYGTIYSFSIYTTASVSSKEIVPGTFGQVSAAGSMILTDIRGRNVSASARVQGVYLSGATHGRLILRRAFVR